MSSKATIVKVVKKYNLFELCTKYKIRRLTDKKNIFENNNNAEE